MKTKIFKILTLLIVSFSFYFLLQTFKVITTQLKKIIQELRKEIYDLGQTEKRKFLQSDKKWIVALEEQLKF